MQLTEELPQQCQSLPASSWNTGAGSLFPLCLTCPCPCPRSASGRGSSSIPAPAPCAASTRCCPRTSRSFLPGTSPAEPALLCSPALLLLSSPLLCSPLLSLPPCRTGAGAQAVLGDGADPWVHWPWEQIWGFTPRSRISPGSCLKLCAPGLAAHKTAAFLAKGH